MSADVLAAVMAAISEWQSTEGAIEVAAYEREEFDADIRDAVMGEGDLERFQQMAAKCSCSGEHKPVQHRDGKPPWCNLCGRDAFGRLQVAGA